MSWKTAKNLNTLPEHYPDLVAVTNATAKSAVPTVVNIKLMLSVGPACLKSKTINLYPMVKSIFL